MNFQVMVLLALILGGVVLLVALPSFIGVHARRRRRKQTAFDERHNSVDLFQSRQEPADPGENREGGG